MQLLTTFLCTDPPARILVVTREFDYPDTEHNSYSNPGRLIARGITGSPEYSGDSLHRELEEAREGWEVVTFNRMTEIQHLAALEVEFDAIEQVAEETEVKFNQDLQGQIQIREKTGKSK